MPGAVATARIGLRSVAVALLALVGACGSNAARPPTDAASGGSTVVTGLGGGGATGAAGGASAGTGACGPGVDAAGGAGGTPRYAPPTRWSLGPIYGTGCPTFGDCETGGSMTDEVNHHLDQLAANDIPITVYHFDGSAWSPDDTCTWALGDALPARLAAGNIRALLHFWGGCTEEADFDHVHGQLGATLAGFYLDEWSTDAMAKAATDWAQRTMPGDSEIVMKGFQSDGWETDAGLAAYGHSCFVNDLPTDFDGLQEGIRRVLWLADTLPAPFNEFTAYYNDRPDEETYFRRIHFGAMQVVMDHSPWQHASPWLAQYGPALLDDFRYFSWLHRELVPYLHSYDWNAYETGEPILRAGDTTAFTTKLGEEIFVAYVTRPRVPPLPFDITLPPGEWIDYWNPHDVVSGTISGPLPPLGKEPIFIANGAIIPMEVSRAYTGHGTPASAGSLTVLIYPKADSSFRYRDDAAKRWVVLRAHRTAGGLELAASDFPSQPLLYRVERWTTLPSSVSICGTKVTVNGTAGIAASASEDAVNGSPTPAWFYDAAAQRLIVKATP